MKESVKMYQKLRGKRHTIAPASITTVWMLLGMSKNDGKGLSPHGTSPPNELIDACMRMAARMEYEVQLHIHV